MVWLQSSQKWEVFIRKLGDKMKKLIQIALWLAVVSLIPIAAVEAKADTAKAALSVKFEAKPFAQITLTGQKVEIVAGESENQKKEKE